MRLWFGLLAVVIFTGCEEPREWKTRQAVRRLAKGPDVELKVEDKVVAIGSYAITDIEQHMHTADDEGRVRLLTALRRIGDPAAIPLVAHVKKWADEDKVRKEAAYTLAALERRARR